jgi:AGZA family xanthine/uracil permease-like MFS transporter
MVRPLVGLVALMVLLSMFFGRYSFKWGMSAVVVSAGLGGILCWVTGIAPNGPCPLGQVGFHPPSSALHNLDYLVQPSKLLPYLPVVLPISFFAVIGALQNIESAAAAGDRYRARDVLLIDGLGTMVGACLGSPFPLTVYIGHPCWKEVGARAGYSVLNGLFITVLCLSGSTAIVAWLVPEDAGLPLIIWAGLIISLQAFQQVPRRYWISIVVGTLPALGAWLSQAIKNVLVTTASPADLPKIFSLSTLARWHEHHIFVDGSFALEQGFVFTSIIWAAMLYYVLDRRFYLAAAWSLFASLLSVVGLIHSWKFAPGGTEMNMPILDWLSNRTPAISWQGLFPGWPYAAAYALITVFLIISQRWAVHSVNETVPL